MAKAKKPKLPPPPPYTIDEYSACKVYLLERLRKLIAKTESKEDIFLFLAPRPDLRTEIIQLSGKAFLLGELRDLRLLRQLSARLLHVPDSLGFDQILLLMDRLQQKESTDQ